MISADYHMHTSFSTDSETPLRNMVDVAMRKGLQMICITDHLDADFPIKEDLGEDAFQLDLECYIPAVSEIREEYRGKIEVRTGVELGLQKHLGERYSQLTNEFPFDFVIGSLHLIRGMDPYYGEIFLGRNDRDVYEEAFIETYECIKKVKCFDVLGHLDYVVRYGKEKEKEYSYSAFSDIIDEILKVLIYDGKGIELNMAGLKYGLSSPNPNKEILSRYKELGGEIITVGSDAHKTEHVGYKFELAEEILKDCGFQYYTEFDKRKTVFRRIP